MWGIDQDDYGKPKALAADYPSLSLQEKHDWITASFFMRRLWKMRKRLDREKKQWRVKHDLWFSYLTEEEKRMMMGELDQEDEEDAELYTMMYFRRLMRGDCDQEDEEDAEFYTMMYFRRLMRGDCDLEDAQQ